MSPKKQYVERRDVEVAPRAGRVVVTGYPPTVSTSSDTSLVPGRIIVTGYAPVVATANGRALAKQLRQFRRRRPDLEPEAGPLFDLIENALLRAGKKPVKLTCAMDYLRPRLATMVTAQARSRVRDAAKKHCDCSDDTIDDALKALEAETSA